jgi:hypothetical protein
MIAGRTVDWIRQDNAGNYPSSWHSSISWRWYQECRHLGRDAVKFVKSRLLRHMPEDTAGSMQASRPLFSLGPGSLTIQRCPTILLAFPLAETFHHLLNLWIFTAKEMGQYVHLTWSKVQIWIIYIASLGPIYTKGFLDIQEHRRRLRVMWRMPSSRMSQKTFQKTVFFIVTTVRTSNLT